MFAVRTATRANFPIRYAFSFVSEAPERIAGIVALALLNRSDRRSRAREGRLPGDRDEADPFGAGERAGEPVRVLVLHVALHALRTELPAVERELFPRLETDHLVVLDLELDAALLPA